MMKFLMVMIFMNFMVKVNLMMMFYYNLYYFLSFLMVFMFTAKDLIWFNISGSLGCNIYSFMLMILSTWVIALMTMSLEKWSGGKMMVFINLLIVLVMFFTFMDLILFYMMFEISLIPIFFIIIYWGVNLERVSASFYMLIYMLVISFPLLIYIFDMNLYGGTMKFNLMALVMEDYKMSFWSFLMIYTSFFIKLPMYMFHIWLPKAHVEAPVYGSMILAGVLLKMGGYGIVRFNEIFYKFSMKFSSWVMSVSLVGSLVVSLGCLTQLDMKSMVAYSSVVHMNLMLGSLITLNKIGVMSGYLMMISHGLCSSGMFYMVNLFYKRSGSRLMFLNKGLVEGVPEMMMWWFFFCVINFSFPISLNFVSEILVLMNILNWNFKLGVILMMICFFSSSYSLYLFAYIYHGKNIYSEKKIFNCVVIEYMMLVLHLFPLIFFLLNLMFFI